MNIDKKSLILIFSTISNINNLYTNNVQLEITQQFHKEYLDKRFPARLLFLPSNGESKQTITLSCNQNFSLFNLRPIVNSAEEPNESQVVSLTAKGNQIGYAMSTPNFSILIPNKWELTSAALGYAKLHDIKAIAIFSVIYFGMKYMFRDLFFVPLSCCNENKYNWIELTTDPITINTRTQTITIKKIK